MNRRRFFALFPALALPYERLIAKPVMPVIGAFASARTVVGERGQELVSLPRGAKVTQHIRVMRGAVSGPSTTFRYADWEARTAQILQFKPRTK